MRLHSLLPPAGWKVEAPLCTLMARVTALLIIIFFTFSLPSVFLVKGLNVYQTESQTVHPVLLTGHLVTLLSSALRLSLPALLSSACSARIYDTVRVELSQAAIVFLSCSYFRKYPRSFVTSCCYDGPAFRKSASSPPVFYSSFFCPWITHLSVLSGLLGMNFQLTPEARVLQVSGWCQQRALSHCSELHAAHLGDGCRLALSHTANTEHSLNDQG